MTKDIDFAEQSEFLAGGVGRDAPALVLIPQDLRTADPSFFSELAAGSAGLAGTTVDLGGASLLRVAPPNRDWEAALLGFGWLSDLRAANSDAADAYARQAVEDWLAGNRRASDLDWQVGVAARRLVSWLSNAGMLLDRAEPALAGRFLAACQAHVRQIARLAGGGSSPDDVLAYTALSMAGLCLTGQDQVMPRAIQGLKSALAQQILPSGGHVGRNPAALVELLLDLLPLKQCLLASKYQPPTWMLDAMERMAGMLRHVQLGDRGLARFNGAGAPQTDRLATVLAYHKGLQPPQETTAGSGYFRLSRRAAVVLVDGGKLPPREFTAGAHAGTLAFEMSAGPTPLIVNAGAPPLSASAWRQRARGIAAHSTLLLNDVASARLDEADADLLVGPSHVEGRLEELADGTAEFRGLHNGYQQRFGMLHARMLRLAPQGDALTGHDRIFRAQQAVTKILGDLSYSIHFHIHPQANTRYGPEPGTALIGLPNGETWRFAAFGSKLSLEDSLYFASFSGPIRTVQIVLRGHVLTDTQISWEFKRGAADPRPQLPTP